MTLTNDDWQTDETAALFDAILTLDSVAEAADFFRDLCTRKELTDLSQRWAVVRMLDEGVPYREIADRLATSTATVTRIAQWLNHGRGGYRRMLDRLEERS